MDRAPRKTASQWTQLVSEYDSGSLSERDFCAFHDIKLITLRKWRYRFKNQAKPDEQNSASSFDKVNVRPSIEPQAAVLCLGSDIRLECPVSYDVTALAQLALAVHHGR